LESFSSAIRTRAAAKRAEEASGARHVGGSRRAGAGDEDPEDDDEDEDENAAEADRDSDADGDGADDADE